MSGGRDGCHLRLVPHAKTPKTPAQLQATHFLGEGKPDRDLARRLARVELNSIDTAIWRHMSPCGHAGPDSGDGAIQAGGRFNPPDSFPVVYGSLSRDTASAEFRRLVRRNPIGIKNFLPRHIYRFRVESSAVLDLRLDATQRILGLQHVGRASIHRAHSQLIGEVARALGIEVIVAPSATGDGAIAAIFPDVIPKSAWEFQHMELWEKATDIPGLCESEIQASGMTG